MSLPDGAAGLLEPVPQVLREVRREVAEAADAQVLQVVRMVDALEVRGATDAVLAPVRARLRAIQPARPLRFARLLFMPADPLIVVPQGWRPGTPFVPRNALMVLAQAVRMAMTAPDAPAGAADCLARTDALIAGATTAQSCVVRQAGALLWPQAEVALRGIGLAAQAAPDLLPAWGQEGLPQQELSPLAGAVSAILGAATALHDHDHGGAAVSDAELTAMLAAAGKLGPRAWSMMLSLLMIRVPAGSAALLVAAHRHRLQRELAGGAVQTALAWVEAETASQPCVIAPNAAAELARQASLLDTLADQPGDADQRRRVAKARGTLQASSLLRFETSMQEGVTTGLHALPAAAEARDAALDTMEATARTLRAFEVEARRLGNTGKFDAIVQGVSRTVHETAGLSAMDGARLMEILAGSEAAVRMIG